MEIRLEGEMGMTGAHKPYNCLWKHMTPKVGGLDGAGTQIKKY